MIKTIADFFKRRKEETVFPLPDSTMEPVEEAPVEEIYEEEGQVVIEEIHTKESSKGSSLDHVLLPKDNDRLKIEVWEGIISSMRSSINFWKNMYEGAKKKISELKEENAELCAEVEQMKKAASRQTEGMTQLRSEIRQMDKTIYEQKEELSKLRSENKEQSRSIDRQCKDYNSLRDKHSRLVEDMLYLRTKNAALSEELITCQKAVGSYSEVVYEELQLAKLALSRQNKMLRNKLYESEGEISKQNRLLDLLEKKLAALDGFKENMSKEGGIVHFYFNDRLYSGKINKMERLLNELVEKTKEELNRWKVDLMFKEEELRKTESALANRREFLLKMYPDYLWVLQNSDKIKREKELLEGTLKALPDDFSLQKYDELKQKEAEYKRKRSELYQQISDLHQEEKDFIREQTQFRQRLDSMRKTQYILENEIAGIIDQEEQLLFVLRSFYKSMPLYDLVLGFLFSFIKTGRHKRIAIQYFKGKSCYEIAKEENVKSKEQIRSVLDTITRRLEAVVRSIEKEK